VSSTSDIELKESVTPTLSSTIESSENVLSTETSQLLDPISVSASLSDFVTSLSISQPESPTEEATLDKETTNSETTETPQNTNATSLATSVAHHKPSPHTKESNTQESIYKTIMKRLSVLEQNMKLSQRFLDEQNKILNDVFVDMERKHQDQLILLIGHLNETASQKIDHMVNHKNGDKNMCAYISYNCRNADMNNGMKI
jgi:hypothetical protein